MTHIVFHPGDHRNHSGNSHAGSIGFYALVGLTVVSALIFMGLYFVSQGALQGLADIVRMAG